MGKIVSQKKFLKGINAGTGVLTEVPGSVTRGSNIVFTQRGSLRTTDGSAIIGQIPASSPNALAMGVFSNLASGQFPFYPLLAGPVAPLVPDVQGPLNYARATPGGNAAGIYVFAVVATDSTGTYHSNYAPSISRFQLTQSFSSITISGWNAQPNLNYTLYYLPGGINASQGVLLTGPTAGASSLSYAGTLPTTPLVGLPAPNNSFVLQLVIGNVVPPSSQVLFTPTAATLPGLFRQPASVSPGDPNFQFQAGSTQVATFTNSGTGTSANVTGTGSNSSTSANTSAFSSFAVVTGQVLTFTVPVTYNLSGSSSGYGGGNASVIFEYSPDGSTWLTIQSFNGSGQTFGKSGSPTLTVTSSSITNLSSVYFRVVCIASWNGSAGSGNVLASGSISAVSVSVTNTYSFTPYGGISGFVCPIPQILQFNQKSIFILGNGIAPRYADPSALGGATFTTLGNTFTASYPVWAATTAWNQGDTISNTVSGTTYVYTAQNGGTSGSGAPSWPTALNATVADGQVIWKNTGVASAIAPRGAAHGIVYAGSLWLANTSPATTSDQIDGPTCLKMSDSGNQNSWNPANTAFIGKDDGTQITGLASYTIAEVGIAPTGALVVFKEFATYQIIGVFGANDFQITQAQTDLGCIAARSIQFLTGYGLARLSHMGFAVFNGVNDTLVSEEIRPYLFGGGQGLNSDIVGVDFTYAYLAQSCQSSSPPMYVCALPLLGSNGALTRLFCYDLVLKAWTILDLPWSIGTLLQARTGEGNPLTLAARTDGTGFVERMFAGDGNWDAASLITGLPAAPIPITWAFSTTHVFRDGSSTRAFYRKVVIRGYATQTTASIVRANVQVNGNPFKSLPLRLQPQPGSGQFELQCDLLVTAQNVQISLTGMGLVTVDALDWDVTAKAGGSIMVG